MSGTNASFSGTLGAGASTVASLTSNGNVSGTNASFSGTLGAGASTLAATTVSSLTSTGNVAAGGNVTATGTVIGSKIAMAKNGVVTDIVTYSNGVNGADTITLANVVDATNAKVSNSATTSVTLGVVASDVKALTQQGNASNSFLLFFRKLFGSN